MLACILTKAARVLCSGLSRMQDDKYRKPLTGMWELVEEEFNVSNIRGCSNGFRVGLKWIKPSLCSVGTLLVETSQVTHSSVLPDACCSGEKERLLGWRFEIRAQCWGVCRCSTVMTE